MFQHDDTTGFQFEGTNPFDPRAEWARSAEFQRHTVRVNGIWRLPYSISLAGAYLFGSGNYFATTYAASPFGVVGTNRYVTAPLTVNRRRSTGSRATRPMAWDSSCHATRCAGFRCIEWTCGWRKTWRCRAGSS